MTYPPPPQESYPFLHFANVICGIGAGFVLTPFGSPWSGQIGQAVLIQTTVDTPEIHKDVAINVGPVDDTRLTLAALLDEVRGTPA